MAYTKEIDERVLLVAQKIIDQQEKKEAELLRQRAEKEEAEKKRQKELEQKALNTPVEFYLGGKVISLDVQSFQYEVIMNFVEETGKFVSIDDVLYSLDELTKVDFAKRYKALDKAGYKENAQPKNAYEVLLEQERQAEFDEYYGKQIVITGDLGNDEGREEALEIASKYLKSDMKQEQKSEGIPTEQEDRI